MEGEMRVNKRGTEKEREHPEIMENVKGTITEDILWNEEEMDKQRRKEDKNKKDMMSGVK